MKILFLSNFLKMTLYIEKSLQFDKKNRRKCLIITSDEMNKNQSDSEVIR